MRRAGGIALTQLDSPPMESLTSLDEVLATLGAQAAGDYVFATTDSLPSGLEPFAVIREAEGLTLVVEAATAFRYGLGTHELFTRITPTAVTALNSVGVTATITQTVASRGIPCNVIAGFNHDHFFVPADRAQEVISVLDNLSVQARGWLESGSNN